MMKNQNTASAKRKRFITNTIVHVILAVLAVICISFKIKCDKRY